MVMPDCKIVTTERRPTAVVRVKARMSELREAQQTGRARLAEVLPTLGVSQLEHSCTLWRPPVDGVLDMEPGVLVSGAFAAVDDVVPSELPAGRAAYFLLRGSFEGLPGAWKTLLDWCAAEKLTLAGVNWEIYGPRQDVEPDQLETALYALLAEAN
jgi:effector-binding domain-containing protein